MTLGAGAHQEKDGQRSIFVQISAVRISKAILTSSGNDLPLLLASSAHWQQTYELHYL
jgi:hypothetical protein